MNDQQKIPEGSPDNIQKSRSFAADMIDYIEIFVFSICITLLIFSFFARICKVDGPSMNNTLYDGEALIISDIAYKPKQNDVIVFHQTSTDYPAYNEPIVKRVIAVGGQYVKIDFTNALVYVSDDEIFDPNDIINEQSYIFLDVGKWNRGGIMETYVPEGKLFVMGDNRNNSADSRSGAIGLVDERRVLGKVLFRITPLSKFGSIY